MAYERLDKNSGKLYRTLAKVAVPIALQSLIGSSLNLVDNLMVGSLGESQLAAVGVSVQIYFIFWMICYGFSSGCSTFMAQFWGAGNLPGIRKTAGFTLTVCFAIGIIFFTASFFFPQYVLRIFTNIPETIEQGVVYVKTGALCFVFVALTVPFECALRATQQTHIPLAVSIVAFSANTFLNYLFIFGHLGMPAMGIKGAALATVISRSIQVICIWTAVFGMKNIISGNLKYFFGWDRSFLGKVVKNAIPTTINESMWGVGTALYVAAFARIGITEYASVQAANTIQNILQMAAFSVGDAILILVGQKLGEEKPKEAYGLAKRLVRIGVIIGVICGGLLIAIAKPVVSLFNFTDAGSHYTFLILIVYGLTMPLVLYNGINVVGVLRCGGDTRFAMTVDVGTVWAIGVPIAFLSALVFHWPIFICILALKTEEAVKSVILTFRFISKKWVRNVVGNIANK